MINDSFINILGNSNDNESLQYQYFNYCLTSFACNLDVNYSDKFLGKCIIPNYLASFNKEGITSDRLFNESVIYMISGFRTNGYHVILKEEKEQIEEQCENILKDKLVIWGMNYLHTALRFNFICTEVIIVKSK